MQIVNKLHIFIAVLSLTAILYPTSISVHIINTNNQQNIDDNATTLFILEEYSSNVNTRTNHYHHIQRRHTTYDPLSNPWLHSKQELFELLWKKGNNELYKHKNDNVQQQRHEQHQTSINNQHHQHHLKHHHQLTTTMTASSSLKNKRINNNNNDNQYLIGKSIDCCPSVLEMVEPHGGTNINGTYVELYQDGSVKQRFYELSCDKYIEGKPCLFMDRKLYNISKCVQKYSYSYALVRENIHIKTTSTATATATATVTTTDTTATTTTSTTTTTTTINTNNRHNHNHNNHRHHQSNFNSASGSGWMLDYIRVRSGCSCEVTPIIYKRKQRINNNNNNNNKHKRNKMKKHG